MRDGAHDHAGTSAAIPLPAPPDALAHAAWRLEPPMSFERSAVLRPEAAHLVDRLLARVARGRGALDVATGELLAALAEGDRALRLGYSGIGDYARERLGIAGRTAQAMARLARELSARPILRQAVREGEVSARKAQAVLPVARGEAEAAWVARAMTETVRALEAAARAASAGETEGAEAWERLCVPLSPAGRGKLEEAMALAGKLLGAASPKCGAPVGALQSSARRWVDLEAQRRRRASRCDTGRRRGRPPRPVHVRTSIRDDMI